MWMKQIWYATIYNVSFLLIILFATSQIQSGGYRDGILRNQVYEYVEQFEEVHVGIIPTDPKFVCYADLPFNLKILICDIWRLAAETKPEDVDHLQEQSTNVILKKFADIHRKRRRNCDYALNYWLRVVNINQEKMDEWVLDIIVKYQDIMIFDRKVLSRSLRRYRLAIPFGMS